MDIGRLKIVLLVVTVFTVSACSGILPRETEETISPWGSFDEAQAGFDRIEIGKTQIDRLKEIGFDPTVNPNITRLTYIDLLSRFLPNQSLRLDDIDPVVSECLRALEACYGLSFTPGEIHRNRFGNALLDIFGFKRQTRITGWRFNGLVVILEDTVVYKIAGGDPKINELEVRKRPLGPLQEIDVRGNVDIN